MPKKEISVQAGITVNLGNYESARIDFAIKDIVVVESDADLADAFEERYKFLGKLINKKKKAILSSKGYGE